jgi:hypothetical protein
MSVDVTSGFFIHSVGGYEDNVREIFRDTFLLGRPLDIEIDNFDLYEEMSLDWYLTTGAPDSAVVIDANTQEVVGYVLVCTKSHDYEQWLRTHVWRVFRKNMARLLTGRMSRVGRQFYWRRFLDAFTVSHTRSDAGITSLAHVHLNIRSTGRSGAMALALVAHADAVCRRAGVDAWTGEVNGVAGTRVKAMQRVVGEIVDIKINRTASFFTHQRVNRITVRRVVQ